MSGSILLRRLNPDRDGEALHAIFGHEESCVYMAAPAAASIAETIKSLKDWSIGCEETSWAVCEAKDCSAQDCRASGRIALIPRGRDIWECACMIVPAARGKNLAARALAIVIEEAFEIRGARRVFADADVDNIASIRTFEKLGFRREGVLRGTWETHIGVRDSVILGILRTDPRPWRA